MEAWKVKEAKQEEVGWKEMETDIDYHKHSPICTMVWEIRMKDETTVRCAIMGIGDNLGRGN